MFAEILRKATIAVWPLALLAPSLACAPENDAPPVPTAARQEAPPSEQTGAPKQLAALPDPLTDEELADGWISLFDGQTLFGWRADAKADWEVQNGTIVVDAGTPGLLRTTTQFSDFVLKLEFRSAPGANSGVFLRTADGPQDPARDCYELNIADSSNPFPTGSLVERQKASGNFDSDGWQAYEVTLDGPQATVKLDGEEVLQYVDETPLGRGSIGLQFREGKVEFRNIKLKPLNLKSLFNGKDLTGWRTYPDMASVFSVTSEGFLNVKGGKGQLETEDAYGDFVLQLECITHAPNLNSGVFFRCIPGEQMNGYESQIHNGFRDGDRAKPMDCGTGGVFRRQDARFVAADDLTWFHNTIVADGPHVAGWVNGIQVTDWTDDRPPDANPRKGLRLDPGTIILQGHDATTDISFRNLRAAEITPR